MNTAELLFGLGGAVVGSVVSILARNFIAHKKKPSVIVAPAWAKTTDPIPVVASTGKPYSNCVFCAAPWRTRATEKEPAKVQAKLWENADRDYGGPTWPKISQGFAIQRCTDCGAHWAYTTISDDAIAEIRTASTAKNRVSDECSDERAWEELEESLKATPPAQTKAEK